MSFQELPPKSCYDLREADPSIVHLDVRTPEEFAAGYPAGASNAPVFFRDASGMQPNPEFLAAAEHLAPDKTKRVILSCAAGGRSAKACSMLLDHGWTQPINQQGGFGGQRGPDGSLVHPGWADSGLPVSQDTGDRAWDQVQAKL
jgi:rhodanese-related sulfurtransferase